MKRSIVITLVCAAGMQLFSQTLTTRATFPANPGADGPVTFVLGTKIYVGGGFLTKELYEYDVLTDKWTKKNDLPGVVHSRCYGTGFTVNDTAYMGMGFDLNGSNYSLVAKKDLWKYDQANDSWTQRSSFPGAAEDAHFSFVHGGLAYVGGGEETLGPTRSELYAYDPLNDNWAQKASFPDPAGVSSPFVFQKNGKVYVSCGLKTDAATFFLETKKTYEYDPANNSWSPKNDFAGNARQGGISFILNDTIYCALGFVDSSLNFMNDFYIYDDSFDSWTPALTATFVPRAYCPVAVTDSGRVFFGLGYNDVKFLYDWYEMLAPAPKVVVQSTVALSEYEGFRVAVYPSLFSDVVHINGSGGEFGCNVVNSEGRVVYHSTLSGDQDIQLSHLPAGVYLMHLSHGDHRSVKKLVKAAKE